MFGHCVTQAEGTPTATKSSAVQTLTKMFRQSSTEAEDAACQVFKWLLLCGTIEMITATINITLRYGVNVELRYRQNGTATGGTPSVKNCR